MNKFVVLSVILLSLTACGMPTDEVKASAELNAQNWCKKLLNTECPAECSGNDSDLDTYVSCTIVVKDQRIPLECAYDQYWAPRGQNHACKEARPINVTADQGVTL